MKFEWCAELNENLKQFWQLDSMKINDAYSDHPMLNEGFISQYESNLKFKKGMYEGKLFWDEKP